LDNIGKVIAEMEEATQALLKPRNAAGRSEYPN